MPSAASSDAHYNSQGLYSSRKSGIHPKSMRCNRPNMIATPECATTSNASHVYCCSIFRIIEQNCNRAGDQILIVSIPLLPCTTASESHALYLSKQTRHFRCCCTWLHMSFISPAVCGSPFALFSSSSFQRRTLKFALCQISYPHATISTGDL